MTIADILASAAEQSGGFRKALALVLKSECEYLHDGVTIRLEKQPGDHGGLTFAGIDKRSHPDFPFNDPQPIHVWKTYMDEYYRPLRCAEMPSALGILVFIQGVNQGVGTAAQQIQFSCNDYGAHLNVDGHISEKTLKAIWAQPDTEGLAMAFLAKSKRHYQEIVARDASQERFLNGWNARIAELKRVVLNA